MNMKPVCYFSSLLAAALMGLIVSAGLTPTVKQASVSSFRSELFEVPLQYQNNRKVTLVEMNQTQIEAQCGRPTDPSLKTIACGDIGGHTVYMPNPCNFVPTGDSTIEAQKMTSYAHLLCHEVAHTEGWNHK